jgi:cyclic pyranopterin phosphate synthase
VWDGIRAAQDAGFSPIKMNVVLIRGENDDEIIDFARLARDSARARKIDDLVEIIDFARLARDSARAGAPIVVRFIEFMPLGETGEKQANWTPEKVVDSQDVLATIRERWPLEIATRQGDHAPASRWRFSDGVGEIGVIPTMTNPFCANCNRLRVTADGFVMRCLFSEKELPFSLRNMMRRREGSTDGEVAAVFREAVRTKKAGQDRDVPDILTRPDGYLDGSRNVSGVTMSQIGG